MKRFMRGDMDAIIIIGIWWLMCMAGLVVVWM